jgi:hypothetical protein
VGAVIRLPARSLNAPLLLAEGPETGLSVWAATGAETWVALGSLSRLELPAGRRMAACRDDDQRYSPADLSITRALRAWRKSLITAIAPTCTVVAPTRRQRGKAAWSIIPCTEFGEKP